MEKRLAPRLTTIATTLGLLLAAHGSASAASDYDGKIRSQVVPKVQSWMASPAVIAAIKNQNQKNAGLSQSQIDNLDKQWRQETSSGGGALINQVLSNDLSSYLSGLKQDGRGVYTEIFVMDNKGLNVGQSDVTSDYWQGDEAKWKKTYLSGADSMLIDEVEFDESTQTFQSQLSLPVVDPATKEVIGAVTVGVNVELLE